MMYHHPGTPAPARLPASSADGSGFYVHAPQAAAEPSKKIEAADDRRPAEFKRSAYFRIKTVVDRLITAALCVIALPVLFIVAMAILVLDGRPVFYRQLRVGKNGCLFRIWKFRTMRPDAERVTGAVWSSLSDPRITRLGRWLRCSHLDELPQFFNILVGEMNLIGPRPERPEFADELVREVTGYTQRTAVRPGITGLAQLRLGYDDSVAHVRKKVRLDLQYIQSASFAQDVWLVACTVPYVARQLRQKWIAGRQAIRWASAENKAELTRKLVHPPSRCDQTGHRGLASPHFLQDLAPTSEAIDRADEECA